MKDAQKIAEIAQSAYIWDLFISSGLFARTRPSDETLEEAQIFLRAALRRRPVGHPERERMLRLAPVWKQPPLGFVFLKSINYADQLMLTHQGLADLLRTCHARRTVCQIITNELPTIGVGCIIAGKQRTAFAPDKHSPNSFLNRESSLFVKHFHAL
jgi:hypothetical protein